MTKERFAHQKSALMAGARPLFVQNGYQGTTTRMLNTALAITAGTLYYYFGGGKRALLDAIVAQGEQWAGLPTWGYQEAATRQELEDQLAHYLGRLWTNFTVPAHYDTLLIVVRERALLTDAQVAWLPQRLTRITTTLAQALPALPVTAAALAQAVVALLQQALFDQLIKCTHPISVHTFQGQIKPVLHQLTAPLVNLG